MHQLQTRDRARRKAPRALDMGVRPDNRKQRAALEAKLRVGAHDRRLATHGVGATACCCWRGRGKEKKKGWEPSRSSARVRRRTGAENLCVSKNLCSSSVVWCFCRLRCSRRVRRRRRMHTSLWIPRLCTRFDDGSPFLSAQQWQPDRLDLVFSQVDPGYVSFALDNAFVRNDSALPPDQTRSVRIDFSNPLLRRLVSLVAGGFLRVGGTYT
jgi:hypothetical protein